MIQQTQKYTLHSKITYPQLIGGYVPKIVLIVIMSPLCPSFTHAVTLHPVGPVDCSYILRETKL